MTEERVVFYLMPLTHRLAKLIFKITLVAHKSETNNKCGIGQVEVTCLHKEKRLGEFAFEF